MSGRSSNCRLAAPLAVVVAALMLAAGALRAAEPAPRPSAVVLVIADGVSCELLTAARLYKGGASARLHLESLPATAIVATSSANNAVTDSSAAATAIARGVKIPNGRLGSAGGDAVPLPGILDIAKQAGWSTGVVSDDAVTGGTPGAFYAEASHRGLAAEIASQAIDRLGSRLDLLLGGGRIFFLGGDISGLPPEFAPVIADNTRKLQAAPIDTFTDWKSFADAVAGGRAGGRPVLGLFAPDVFPYIADGPREPRLADMTRAAVAVLKSRGRPFLLIVEAALPDKACHRNFAKRAILETLELDATLELLDNELGPDALILATTDHATGGLAINGHFPPDLHGDALLGLNPASGISILSWATGPAGVNPAAAPQAPQPPAAERTPIDTADPNYQQPTLTYTGSALHTAGDVWLAGRGPGSNQIHGFLDNTAIFAILKSAITGDLR